MKSSDNSQELEKIATKLRQGVIEMLAKAGSGHAAGSLGMADVFTALYFGVLKHDPQNPNWKERDYLILSNGHICPIFYATLAECGYFDKKLLKTLRKINSPLQGHPHYGSLPGVENTSGSLGQGLSQAAGLALALRMNDRPNRVFCLTSDGEHQEGQTWESYMLAAARELGNLTVLIDRNNIQISGFTQEVMPLEPLSDKLLSFGWKVLDINGHDLNEIIKACSQVGEIKDMPTAIICQTTAGKGVKFMEHSPVWHGKVPDQKQAQQAIAELQISS